jgi:excisionase family DNA binding protein
MNAPEDLMPSAVPDRLLSPGEVALFLSVPVKTLYQWRYKGIGPRGLRVGRHLRYRQDEIEAWLDALDDPAGHGLLR